MLMVPSDQCCFIRLSLCRVLCYNSVSIYVCIVVRFCLFLSLPVSPFLSFFHFCLGFSSRTLVVCFLFFLLFFFYNNQAKVDWLPQWYSFFPLRVLLTCKATSYGGRKVNPKQNHHFSFSPFLMGQYKEEKTCSLFFGTKKTTILGKAACTFS